MASTDTRMRARIRTSDFNSMFMVAVLDLWSVDETNDVDVKLV